MEMKLCECGCEGMVKEKKSRFCQGHGNRSDDVKEKKRQTNLKNSLFDNPFKDKNKIQKSWIDKFGVDNPSKLESIREKISQSHKNKTKNELKEIYKKSQDTCLKTRGVVHWMKLLDSRNIISQIWKNKTEYDIQKITEKNKQTYLERTGYENPFHNPLVREKYKETMIKSYNCENPSQVEKFKEKRKQTNQKLFGVDYATQCKYIHDKQLKNSFRRKKYILPSGKEILLQGEEPQFLDYIFSNNILKEEEIEFHPKRIEYFTEDGKKHYYFADFRIIPFNLIVEIKSSYILSFTLHIVDLKISTVKSLGYKFIMIIDKKYEELRLLIDQLKQKENYNV